MKRSILLSSIGVALGVWAAAPAPAQDAAFHEAQLRSGREAMAGRRVADAIDHFRIAAFGFLERPPLLAEALARLALAEQAARSTEKLDATIARLLAVEQKFSSLRAARLEAETRGALRRLLETRAPRESLAAIQSLAPVPPKPTAAPAAGSPRPTRSAPPRPTAATPSRQADDSDGDGPVRRPTPAAAPAAAAPAEEADAVYASPRYHVTVKPLYPASALRDRIGGIVLLRVLVSETGEAMEIAVARAVHPDLSAAAVGAVRQWAFEPARRNGVPVAAWTTVPIPFRP